MFSVGTDILDISRIKRLINDNPRFFERFYGENEQAELKLRSYPPETAAGMFCAKEAFSKALGTGVVGFSLNEVELLHHDNGAPYLKLSGKALEIAIERQLDFSVSISHTNDIATAVVIAYGK